MTVAIAPVEPASAEPASARESDSGREPGAAKGSEAARELDAAQGTARNAGAARESDAAKESGAAKGAAKGPDADRASALITALAALPEGDPARPALRDRTIEAWLPMARHLAHRYAGRGEPADDLYQVAVVGLIKAVDRFEAGRGVDFAGYAIPTVIGEIKRHFRDRTWSVRVPRRLQELRLAITTANNELSHSLGRAATVADIAGHLGVTEEDVLEGLEGARAYNATSLSLPVGADGSTELGETLGGEDRELELAELRLALGPALATLDDRERRIIQLRFYGNLTQTQIAERIGISQMHVSRLLSRALVKLRGHLGEAC